MNMPALASAPQMVGRRAEFDALREAFDDARAGHPRTAIVRGEAGIGKTRLVAEFLADVAQRHGDMPVVIAQGQCVDLGPIGAPFGPVRRVLRDLHAEVGTEALQAAAGSPAAVAALAALLPGIAAEPSGADDHAGEFAEAIEVLLESLSATHHVVVVIEDLQWADAATLALLKTLASTLRGRHLTIVATYRSDDIDRFHPLRPVLAELERTRGIIRIDLAPLSIEEVAEQVGQLVADGTVDGPRLTALAERSGGIPFLVEELVDLGDAGLPDTLRDLVLARYARLSDGAQQTLRAMAAGGVHVDHEALAAVAGVEERALDILLREAIEARVVLAEGAGYTFRHALTHEAVHAEMLPSEKVRLHRAYAEHVARRPEPSLDDLSALAEHWLAARDLGAAFDATVAALERSRAGYSPATSAKLAERLTELWDQVPDAQRRAGATLAELHLTAALAWHDLSEAERALRAANEGLATRPDDPITRAALLRQRFVQQFNHTHDGRREDLEEAIALLEDAREHRARVLLSRTLSNLAMGEEGEQAAAHAREAIRIAEEADDAPALAVALTVEMWRLADDVGDEPAALAPIERAAGLRLDPSVRSYVAGPHVDLLMRLGRFDEAILVGEQQYADAVRSGIERGAGSGIAYLAAQALFAAGRPDDARRYAQRAQRFAAGTMRASGVRIMAAHHAWNDETRERDELLDAERSTVDLALRTKPRKQDWWIVDRGGWMAVTEASSADGVSRADALEALLTLIDADPPHVIRRYATVAAAMLARLDDDAAVHARLTTEATSWPQQGVAPLMSGFVRASLAIRASASDQIAQWRPIVDQLEEAGGMPVWHRHVARLRLAAALIEAGERDEAGTILERIRREAPSHGVALLARRAAELAAHARLAPGSAPTGTAPPGGVLDALTARELQVLELIAEGLTNPQIGKRLFISPKTASVHVSAILAKIGAANRADAAALYAAR